VLEINVVETFAGRAAEFNTAFVTHDKLAERASTFALAFNVVNDRSFLVAEVFKLLQVVRALAFVYFVETNDRAFEATAEVSVVYGKSVYENSWINLLRSINNISLSSSIMSYQ
jgi:hypothetical protein